MFGRSILICPKMIPKNETEHLFGNENFISFCSLPETDHYDEESLEKFPALWYYWYDKTA